MARAITVYDHIEQNNLKTWLLVLLFPISLTVLVWLACLLFVILCGNDVVDAGVSLLPQKWQYSMGGYLGAATGFAWDFLLPTFIMGVIWMTISYFFGGKMMMAFAEAKPMNKKENPDVYNLVENTAIMAGLPMPKVYIIDDDSLNAFATGMKPKDAAIALTSGIINHLEKTELQGVIAHEMAHIGNRDIRLNMLIITGLGIFESLGRSLLRSEARSSNNKKNSGGLILFIAIALLIFNFLIAPLIHMAISRKREFAADATGAKILHNPKALADALEKISVDSRVEVLDKQKNMAVACIASPFAKVSQLTSTHPPINERIRRLRNM
ncbi:MAG: M48 family metallopeptidase [Alphaproteobacteria bacterium]|nr:M48 family metallopeptidase [Alphaproteobacteria bacterium]